MPSQKSIPISELITTANSELLRLDFKRSALQIYCAEFRKLSDYYSNEKIQDYTATTGREYFQSIYGVNIASSRLQLTKSQSATRRGRRWFATAYCSIPAQRMQCGSVGCSGRKHGCRAVNSRRSVACILRGLTAVQVCFLVTNLRRNI